MHFLKNWGWPAIAFLLITPFTPFLDLAIAHFFYLNGNDRIEPFISSPFLDFLFEVGPLPANLLALGATILLIISYLFKRFKFWRNPMLVLLLTYAVGAGLITNALLKEYWGRPRPKQVEEFGGTQAFRPYYLPNFFHQPQPSKSFPCGHCAAGYYFFALALVGRRLHSKKIWYFGIALAFILGITLSVARMAQGGHFLSDTLFSAVLMWYTALAIDWLVYAGEELP